MTKSVDECLTGTFLYGDDFGGEQIEQWFHDEESAYFNLDPARDKTFYPYRALHHEHGLRYLPPSSRFRNVLGLGSAYGLEFAEIRQRCERITIVDSATDFQNASASYVKPRADGALDFADSTFDLITCFNVLHHICNVSAVFAELARCLAPGGFLLLSEPITSMGDWRKPRHGLTQRERGIPVHCFRNMIDAAHLRILRESRFEFRPLANCSLALGVYPYNSGVLTKLDRLICRFLPDRYHATTRLQKFRPVSTYFVLTKPQL